MYLSNSNYNNFKNCTLKSPTLSSSNILYGLYTVYNYYSNYGTAIDVYAPGTAIVTSGISAGNTYYANSSYYQVNESGTSFSAPQVAGVLSLFLQQNPGASPASGKKWITANGQGCIDTVIADTGLTNDYTSNYTLSGGNNKFLNNPFSFASASMGDNGIQFQGGILTLQT